MARAVTARRKAVTGILAWTLGLLIFFPILWIIILIASRPRATPSPRP